jgi:hypothetical protein
MEIVTMKRAIITAFAAIGLSSIAGISFAETELSSAQLDDVTAGGGMTHRSGTSSFTWQSNSNFTKQYGLLNNNQTAQSNQNQTSGGGGNTQQANTQAGLVNVGANVGSVRVLK